MAERKRFSSSRFWSYSLATGFLFVMVWQFFYGERGFFALQQRSQEHEQHKYVERQLQKENALWNKKVSALREESLDLDELERQVKQNLGLYRKGERVIIAPSP